MIDRIIQGYGKYKSLLEDIRTLAASGISTTALQRPLTTVTDARRGSRQIFGRAISMDKIERAMKAAYRGNMEPFTDLSRETIDTDPHLCSVLFKRFGSVTTLPLEIHPAAGPGVDKERAKYYASVVREHVLGIPNLHQRLLQLGWGLFDGRSAQEINWRPAKSAGSPFGRVSIVPDQLEWIHPRRLCFDPRRQLVVLDEGQRHAGNFASVGFSLDPDELRRRRLHTKFIQWKPSLFGEYQEREGLAPRALYWSFFKRYSQRERMILIELFGKPWRIIEVDEDSDASAEDLDDADLAADQLGGSSSARMPRGTKLNVVQLDAKSSENHRAVIEDCDRQLSKLVLGQTGTTDPNPAGINNTQADVMQAEQAGVLIWDSIALGEIVTAQLCRPIIELNFGADELIHAPRFVLRWDRPTDRRADIERLKKALDAGVEVALTEAYESTGYRQPESDEPVVRIDQPPQTPGSANPPVPRPVVVYPPGESPATGEQLPSAEVADVGEGSRANAAGMISTADLAKTVTVNEARAAQELPPLMLPDGSADPDGDLTLVEFEAKKTAASTEGFDSALSIVAGRTRIEDVRTLHRHYDAITAELGCEVSDRIFAEAHAGEIELAHWFALANDNEDVSDHTQPETDNGNPEEIIENGKKELTRAAGKWADHLGEAVVGLGSAGAIYNAVNRAAEDLDAQPYGRALERRMLHTAALGAIDSNLDIGGLGKEGFSKLSFQKAMKIFRQRDIVTKAVWNSLEAEAKRKAFTVAGLQTRTMVQAIHAELARQIGQGADLREFRKFMTERLQSSGLIGAKHPQTGIFSANHVETVFRTNALNAYGAGRHSHASQPAVIRARPVWGISGIGDSRSRRSHRKAHGKYLYASDPFWKQAYPPFGFNCRCRVNTHRLSRDVSLAIVPGSSLSFLPDRGFVSGVSNLLS
ncbi:MAG: DUF935 family protein [Deltaproteobacteria bacterium]|nr:DUF935 family protein [Deltaproteobacteria bacterium]